MSTQRALTVITADTKTEQIALFLALACVMLEKPDKTLTIMQSLSTRLSLKRAPHDWKIVYPHFLGLPKT